MLNELLSLERGLAGAGFDVAPRHADVAAPGRTAALQVRLDTVGLPVELAALDADLVARLWTLRNGKHNSFPYVQLKRPLLSDVTDADGWKEIAASEKRRLLHTWIGEHPADTAQPPFGTGLRESLVRRRAALSTLGGREAAVPAVIDRVLGVDGDEDAESDAEAWITSLPGEITGDLGYQPVVVDGVPSDPAGDCSSPVPLPASFTPACLTHDLGYDLLRVADATGEAIPTGVRPALDRQLASRMAGSCTESGLRGVGCRAMAGVADAAVTANSWRQNDGAPVKETWPWS